MSTRSMDASQNITLWWRSRVELTSVRLKIRTMDEATARRLQEPSSAFIRERVLEPSEALKRERAKTSFNISEVTDVIYGGKEIARRRLAFNDRIAKCARLVRRWS